jgi:hypothetical protein
LSTGVDAKGVGEATAAARRKLAPPAGGAKPARARRARRRGSRIVARKCGQGVKVQGRRLKQ